MLGLTPDPGFAVTTVGHHADSDGPGRAMAVTAAITALGGLLFGYDTGGSPGPCCS